MSETADDYRVYPANGQSDEEFGGSGSGFFADEDDVVRSDRNLFVTSPSYTFLDATPSFGSPELVSFIDWRTLAEWRDGDPDFAIAHYGHDNTSQAMEPADAMNALLCPGSGAPWTAAWRAPRVLIDGLASAVGELSRCAVVDEARMAVTHDFMGTPRGAATGPSGGAGPTMKGAFELLCGPVGHPAPWTPWLEHSGAYEASLAP